MVKGAVMAGAGGAVRGSLQRKEVATADPDYYLSVTHQALFIPIVGIVILAIGALACCCCKYSKYCSGKDSFKNNPKPKPKRCPIPKDKENQNHNRKDVPLTVQPIKANDCKIINESLQKVQKNRSKLKSISQDKINHNHKYNPSIPVLTVKSSNPERTKIETSTQCNGDAEEF